MEHFCEICGKTKPCGMIVAMHAEEDGGWSPALECVACAECADGAGEIAAGYLKTWVTKAQR